MIRQKSIIIFLIIFFGVLFFAKASLAATYYVAKNGNNNNSGAIDRPWLTIQKAANTMQAGDTVYVRSGTYNEDIMPVNSGISNNYITYSAYSGETVTLQHNPAQDDVAVELGHKSYITINGFNIDGNNTGGLISGYNNDGYITISNNTMVNCASDKYGILVTKGNYWHIYNNTFTFNPATEPSSGVDTINLKSSYHLVEGNTIVNGPHSAITIAGGSYIVVRNNTLSNIYNQVITSTGSGGVWGQKILYENNTMVGGGLYKPVDTGLAQGIQLGSQQTIVRHNVFSSAYSAGVELSFYYTDNEARDVHGDRIYNNVMFGNNDGGIRVSRYDNPAVMSDNIFKNNILRSNRRAQSDSNLQQLYFVDFASGKSDFDYIINNINFSYNDLSTASIRGNIIGGASNLGPDIVHPLSWWQTNYSSKIANNLETDAKFINETGHDFHLAAGSPLIDAGTSLTTAVGVGNGTQLTIADVKYFSDGFGVVAADWIKIGNSDPVQISSIDYDTNVITLTSSRSWSNGDSVNLYKDSSGNVVLVGSAPDMGAYEYLGVVPDTTPPAAPTGVVVN
jgi:hypothetical protein